MNALLPLFTVAGDASTTKAANLLSAARAMVPHLNRSRALDRRLVAAVMTTSFGASDAEGAWLWRDAYDAIEAALVLQLRRLSPQIARLEDAPSEIVALLANLSGLGLTHTRRSEEQAALDQFSTPPQLGALAVLAAQVRAGDLVLEPSAGTGLLAILAEACGGVVTLNEIAANRAALLEGLFPLAVRSAFDAAHLPDLLSGSGSFEVALVNPPFQALEAHLHAALDSLADGGRLAAIVPSRLFEANDAMKRLCARGAMILRLRFPARAYVKHGTSVETGLLVLDRGGATGAIPAIVDAETLADAARAAAGVTPRPTAKARQFRTVDQAALLAPRARQLATPAGRLALLAQTAPVAYETCAWSGEGHDVGLYQAYSLGRVRFERSAPHP
ncbi:MAG: class I SAM-dependent methyltransferase, partial [Caulobacterales bacterium]|nr:class I SAM-dependent methyltransferase [Caulobacterales bacterium]